MVGTPRRSGPRIGIALSPTTVCAAIRAGGGRVQPWRASVAPLNGDGSSWSALADALRSLTRDSGIVDGRLTIALMPPLAEARGVELPPVSDKELQALLARNAGRYFVGVRGTPVVGAVRGARTGEASATVAAAASARLVNAIHQAAADAGWDVEAVIPAEAAWTAAANHWASRVKGTTQLLVAHTDRTDLLRIERSQLAGIRRFRAGAVDAELIANASGDGAGYLGIVGNPDTRRELTRQLASRGLSVDTPTSAVTEIAEQPDLLAAAFADRSAMPQLVTDATRSARGHLIRSLTMRVSIAAAVLLIVAGLAELWGIRRELSSVQTQRRAIKPQLSATIVGQTSLLTAYRQIATLTIIERTAPHWSGIVDAITQQLPSDAFLTGLRGHGDSLEVNALGTSASRAIDAFYHVRGLTKVTAPTGITKEFPKDSPPLERFRVIAQIGSGTAPTPAAGAPKK